MSWNPGAVIEESNSVATARFEGKSEAHRGAALIYSVLGESGATRTQKLAKFFIDEGNITISVPIQNENESVSLKAVDDYGRVYNGELMIRSKLDLFEKKRFDST